MKQQIDALEEQPKAWTEGNDRTVFSFNYSEIQKRIAPQVFDSDSIQIRVKDTPEEKPVRYPFYYNLVKSDAEPNSEAPYYRLFISQVKKKPSCDFLSIYYNSLFNQWKIPSRGLTVFAQRSMINMQDAALYVCCNWDAQDQIIKALQDIDSFGTRRYDRMLSDADPDPDYPLEFANSFYEYLFRYLFEKNAPSLPDCSGETKHESTEESENRDYYLDKFAYCVEENVEYYKVYSRRTIEN